MATGFKRHLFCFHVALISDSLLDQNEKKFGRKCKYVITQSRGVFVISCFSCKTEGEEIHGLLSS